MTICFLERAGCAGGGKGILCSEEKTFTLSTVDNMRICMEEKVSVIEMGDNQPCVMHNTVVRRLTPVECERLQGFPDNYTNIPWGKKDTTPDGRRYKALGNSMAVPVMQWIGKRMLEAKQVVCDEDAINRILYVTPSDDGQLSLF
jgi:site-specific DNA-cytosine methylase